MFVVIALALGGYVWLHDGPHAAETLALAVSMLLAAILVALFTWRQIVQWMRKRD